MRKDFRRASQEFLLFWHQWQLRALLPGSAEHEHQRTEEEGSKDERQTYTKVTVILATCNIHYIQYFLVSRCVLFPQTTSDQNLCIQEHSFYMKDGQSMYHSGLN